MIVGAFAAFQKSLLAGSPAAGVTNIFDSIQKLTHSTTLLITAGTGRLRAAFSFSTMPISRRQAQVRDVPYTDGVKHVAETARACWLIDEIAFAPRGNSRLAAEECSSGNSR